MTYAESSRYDLVRDAVNDVLWQKCKWIRNEDYLGKATKLVCDTLQLEEHTKLEGMKKEEAIVDWCVKYKDLVREIHNYKRNYCNQEVGEEIVDMFKEGKGLDFIPTPSEIHDLATRNPVAWGDTPAQHAAMDKKFVFYWDVVLSKICGNSTWCVTKRCYGHLSTHGPEPTKSNPDPEPYVDPSSEAFAVWMFENFYDRWQAKAAFLASGIDSKELLKKQPKDTKGNDLKDENGEWKETKMNTKYSDHRGGQQPFGGFTQAGRKRLLELNAEMSNIRKNKEEEWVNSVGLLEERVLQQVRAIHKRDEIDAKRNKKVTKKATHMASAATEPEEVCIQDDMNQW